MKLSYIFTLLKNYKSFIFCYKAFGFKTALNLPIIIGKNVKHFGITRDNIKLSSNPYPGMIRLGVTEGSSGIWKYDNCDGVIDLTGGTLTLGKGITISKGFCLKSIEGASLSIGNNFSANTYLTILAKQEISIADNCMLGWNVLMNDGDGHSVISATTGEILNSKKSIKIDNHVWIGAHASILKGSHIHSDSIVGYGTITGKDFLDRNVCIVGGHPGRIAKYDINWKN